MRIWMLLLQLVVVSMAASQLCGKCGSNFAFVRALVTNRQSRARAKLVHCRNSNIGHRGTQPLAVPRYLSTNTRLEALPPPRVWVEEAEEGFVDEEENLEPGEICLRSVKSFASGFPTDRLSEGNQIRLEFEVHEEQQMDQDRRFLGAGALIQRNDCESEPGLSINGSQSPSNVSGICDAWMADSMLKEGGPNLQLQGAILVLDDLFLNHLHRERKNYIATMEKERTDSGNYNNVASGKDGSKSKDDDSWAIRALQNFVVHCGEDNDFDDVYDDSEDRPWRSTNHVVASEMAAEMRGFVPLREMIRISSIYNVGHYHGDTSGLVLDPLVGMERYLGWEFEGETAADLIASLLPSEENVARYTTKRFTIARQREKSQ